LKIHLRILEDKIFNGKKIIENSMKSEKDSEIKSETELRRMNISITG